LLLLSLPVSRILSLLLLLLQHLLLILLLVLIKFLLLLLLQPPLEQILFLLQMILVTLVMHLRPLLPISSPPYSYIPSDVLRCFCADVNRQAKLYTVITGGV
jgi:hypothetical protein